VLFVNVHYGWQLHYHKFIIYVDALSFSVVPPSSSCLLAKLVGSTNPDLLMNLVHRVYIQAPPPNSTSIALQSRHRYHLHHDQLLVLSFLPHAICKFLAAHGCCWLPLSWTRLDSLMGSPGLSWALLGSPGLSWSSLDSPGLSWARLDFPKLSRALLDFPRLSWALLGSPGLSWALLGSHELSWAFLGSPRQSSALLSSSRLSYALWGSAGL
jgi:hypothetical protein